MCTTQSYHPHSIVCSVNVSHTSLQLFVHPQARSSPYTVHQLYTLLYTDDLKLTADCTVPQGGSAWKGTERSEFELTQNTAINNSSQHHVFYLQLHLLVKCRSLSCICCIKFNSFHDNILSISFMQFHLLSIVR